MPANVLDMVSVRHNPWHGPGKVVPEEMSLYEAFNLGGLNYEVEKIPLYRLMLGGVDVPPRYLPLDGKEYSYKFRPTKDA